MCLNCRRLTLDRAGPAERQAFAQARRAEIGYARQLRKVARAIDDIVRGLGFNELGAEVLITAALNRYAALIEPWAGAVGRSMVTEVAARNEQAWMRAAAQMSESLRQEIRRAPTGAVMREKLTEQVGLITSLPRDAAARAQKIALEARTSGIRAEAVGAKIMRLGEVSEARANTIARTEVSRTATALTEARALHIGSEEYVWRTSKDTDVRPSHRAMEGKVVRWDSPPVLDRMTGHAGSFPNCRCYPEAIIPAR
ncbi:phage head morphogenesis protein [Salinarimonas soli]|uniref:Phage head morphogenesis protein n=1 Tax=Salinarimonas soli TaxID=1638099 RepID=A0A5B2VEY7_9HYPH|nr:phage minor head protein [Salinarimonas soli]KAA2237681.1 phage head morphogenesis protein [Salinarimonas soli]